MILGLLLGCLRAIDPPDRDSDGYFFVQDCNDHDHAVHVGAEDVCDHVDNDCDGIVDPDAPIWYLDEDDDHWGGTLSRTACVQPPSFVAEGGDCDDADASVHPDAEEACTDPEDRNCDGVPGVVDADRDGIPACLDCDDDAAAVGLESQWWFDADGDHYGAADAGFACEAPAGAVARGDDCDDADADVHPGASELCTDPTDFDCDPSTGTFADEDGDGYAACLPYGLECDDTRADAHAGADERCNGLDDDCDHSVDEEDAVDATTWYPDTDLDGYGVDVPPNRQECVRPGVLYTAVAGDCDALDATIYPGAPEACGPVDQNCDGSPGDDDADGDGFLSCEECADADPMRHPGAPEADCADPVDWNCDGSVGLADVDADGAAACHDCDDADAAVQGAVAWYEDLDGDGFGAAVFVGCLPPSARWVAAGGDCDDADASVFPGAGCP
jgi:hypothetical protein